jgi:glycerophosphoryl diester phosphodiesterase
VSVFADTPVLCGHRGSGRGEHENTLESYRAAVACGLRWVEVDARITADDVLVARHDPVTGDGRFIAELTAAETDELGIMRVTDLFEDLPPAVAVDVDVKTSLEDALRPRRRTTAALVADLLRGEQARRELLVTSFDPAVLLIVRERTPALPLGLLTWIRFPLREAVAAAAQLGVAVVAAHMESFVERDTAASLSVAHEAGLQVAAWCPEAEEQDALIEAGIDCLVIDDVPAAAARRPSA